MSDELHIERAERLEADLTVARRENATLREALEEAFRWIARLPNPSPATCAYVPEAVYERIGAALAASPAAEEPQP